MATINSKASISPDGGDGAIVVGVSLHQIIKQMFANGEQGFAYDPNDLSTMFQDAAGTVPVTGTGQPVGLVKDKSGRNNHAFQTNAASRPLLQRNATTGAYYLAFDGSDDFLVTNSIDFTATDKISLFAGVRKLSDAGTGLVFELSANSETTRYSFALFAPSAAGANSYNFRSFGSSGNAAGTPITTAYPAPHSAVLTASAKISTSLCRLSINRASPLLIAQSQGTGNYGNYPLYIGRRGGTTLPFNGHIYSIIGIGRLTTNSEAAAIEKELAKRTGVTLNV
ncbi:hypothetical protein [Acinetobacter sp.]|uniref:hypothetical protein n=1 Tax=Acinetobacter sp. TaxID=472 RepID=UPI0035B4F503